MESPVTDDDHAFALECAHLAKLPEFKQLTARLRAYCCLDGPSVEVAPGMPGDTINILTQRVEGRREIYQYIDRFVKLGDTLNQSPETLAPTQSITGNAPKTKRTKKYT